MAWTREEIREVTWRYMYCRKYLTGNYKMYMDANSQTRKTS